MQKISPAREVLCTDAEAKKYAEVVQNYTKSTN